MSYSPREPIWILKYEVASLLADYSFAPKSCEGPVHPLARGPDHCSEVLLAKRIPDNDTLARCLSMDLAKLDEKMRKTLAH